MWVTSLERKLLRELSRLAGQIATIALVVASGVTSFISLRGTYASLEASRLAYYDRQRFADVFATATRVPEQVARELESVPGVAALETRVVEEVTLPIEGMPRPAYGRIASLPDRREPRTNAIHLRKGRLPERGRDDEVVLLDSFAEAHALEPNDSVPIVINGKLRKQRIVGIALSPEYVFAIRPGALSDDPKRYAVLWMDRTAVASAYGLDGAFNEVSARLEPGASSAAVCSAFDRILEPYGGNGAIPRKDQLSHRVLSQELGQLQTLATMVPLVFLGVAAFLLNLVLARLIRLQRPEIATLKAVGYGNRAIGWHYLALVAVVLVPGGLLGLIAGHALGRLVLGLYAGAFRFPNLVFSVPGSVLAMALVTSALAATLGALGAVAGAVRLSPAEAMRPPAPALYRKGFFDKLGSTSLLGTPFVMVLREIQRRPLRTLLSSLGIAGAVALLVLGRFGWDSLTSYFDHTFRREQRHDLQVAFSEPLPPRVVRELERMPGVTRAEGIRAVPVRVRQAHRTRDTVLMGVPPDATLRQLVSKGGALVRIPEEGVVMSKALGEVLDIRVGDRPELEIREGERMRVRPVVAGFVDDSVGLTVYASTRLVATLEQDTGAFSSVLLSVEPARFLDVEARLRESPRVIDVSDVRADMNRLFDMNAQIMDIWTAISVALAASVVFGVVYNNARIALSARSRELASLRVLGFSRREVSAILLYGLAVEVGIAIPVGLLLGRLWAEQFMRSVDQETFRWEVSIAPQTYVLVTVVVLLAAAASALWVRRNVDHLDLIAVLKARE